MSVRYLLKILFKDMFWKIFNKSAAVNSVIRAMYLGPIVFNIITTAIAASIMVFINGYHLLSACSVLNGLPLIAFQSCHDL